MSDDENVDFLSAFSFWKNEICMCCSCEFGWKWDPMCRQHGAHGFRECEKHTLPREECVCERCVDVQDQ